MTDLFTDLKDGTLLLSLLEVLSGKAMVSSQPPFLVAIFKISEIYDYIGYPKSLMVTLNFLDGLKIYYHPTFFYRTEKR